MDRPFLLRARSLDEWVRPSEFPWTIAAFRKGIDLSFTTNITIFVGENGTGKSTLLEALAEKCGFNAGGGNRDHRYAIRDLDSPLSSALSLQWRMRLGRGFFLRAETFFNYATFKQDVGGERFGGPDLHERSHGEAFLAVFKNFEDGIYLLDEPEAALSPARQLAFLRIVHDIDSAGCGQIIMATHSPIILAYPGATLLQFDDAGIHRVRYEETEHYQLTRSFLNDPALYFEHLFADE